MEALSSGGNFCLSSCNFLCSRVRGATETSFFNTWQDPCLAQNAARRLEKFYGWATWEYDSGLKDYLTERLVLAEQEEEMEV